MKLCDCLYIIGTASLNTYLQPTTAIYCAGRFIEHPCVSLFIKTLRLHFNMINSRNETRYSGCFPFTCRGYYTYSTGYTAGTELNGQILFLTAPETPKGFNTSNDCKPNAFQAGQTRSPSFPLSQTHYFSTPPSPFVQKNLTKGLSRFYTAA